MQKIEEMEIKTSFGGPCVYVQGIFPDGTKTGLIQNIGQPKAELKKELFNSLQTDRDDCKTFIDSILAK